MTVSRPCSSRSRRRAGVRKAELDERREVGLITREPRAVKRLRTVFEGDWAESAAGKRGEPDAVVLAGAAAAGDAGRPDKDRGLSEADAT